MTDPEITAERFRHVLGHLPTGVAIVASHGSEGRPVGMSVNSLTSLSLDPPMILLCPAKSSETWPSIRDAGTFCVSIMSHEDEDMVRRFAVRGVDRFAGVSLLPRPHGPGIGSAIAWIECRLHSEHEGGDHTVAIAEVIALDVAAEVTPLVFFQGRYGTFEPGSFSD